MKQIAEKTMTPVFLYTAAEEKSPDRQGLRGSMYCTRPPYGAYKHFIQVSIPAPKNIKLYKQHYTEQVFSCQESFRHLPFNAATTRYD